MAKQWPPKHVTVVRDRHGKARYRWRHAGKSAYIAAPPSSPQFWQQYEALEADQTPAPVAQRQYTPRSLDDLASKVMRTYAWKSMKPLGQRTKKAIIECLLDKRNRSGARLGDRQVKDVNVAMLDGILSKMTPGTAGNHRKEMKRLFGYAVKLGWRIDNPAALTSTIPTGTGFHTWTEDEIAQFRATHAIGTTARLVLELALNTGARRCNLHLLDRSNIVGNRIRIAHAKGNNETSVPMLEETRAALDALPSAPIRFLITTQFGKPFTVAGLGNKMREWCNEAGLPQCSLHGLRKAVSRRLAESGATDAQGRSVTGHKRDTTFAEYAKMADRQHLATAAMSNLATAGLSNLAKD